MPMWSDNFNRDDGPLGSDWSVTSGSVNIVSNKAQSGGAATMICGPSTAPGAATAEATVSLHTSNNDRVGPLVKASGSGGGGHVGTAYADAGHVYYAIYGLWAGPPSLGASYTWTGTPPATVRLRLTWTAGTLRLYADGTEVCSYYDNQYAAQTRMGLWFTSSTPTADDFSAAGDGTPALYVTPSVIGTDDGDTPITIMGTAITWTPGTPGSPSFTCDAGALTSQTIDSTTNARAIFSPPGTAQVVTITDPANSISDTITVVEGTYLGGGQGGAGNLPENVVEWLQLQASHAGLILTDEDQSEGEVEGTYIKGAFGELLFGKRKTVGESPYPDYVTAVLADLYARVWGGEEWQSASFAESGTNALKTDLLALLARWDTGNPPALYSAADLLELLGGVPLANHQDILTAIGNVSGGDNQEVLDAIAAAQGDPLATIKACIDLVYALGTTNNWDLDDVKTWAEAIRGSGLPTIKSVMDKLGTSGNTIEARLDAISDLIVTQGTIQGMLDILLTAITGGVGVTLTSISDDILDAISNIPAATAPPMPMWPGLANVTLGDAVALSDGLEVTGPMHGLLFTITGHPSGAGKYEFGEVDSWQHTGGVIFCSDNGDYERAESFGLERQILVPRTMEQAASATIRLNTAWSGTVRTWVRSS